ncbi:MAG: lysophospholipase [Anaerocolumna sp.]|jgi:esterase/lipase|nr:lysophospholipase [Anaerocolumna sp.]
MGSKFRSIRGILIKSILILVSVVIILIIIAPPIIVHFATSGHINYAGNTNKNVLQDIYQGEDFDLETTELTLSTDDGLNIWTSEVFVENPKAVIIYLTGIRQPSITYFYGHSRWMKKNGFATMLLEVRGHGNSSGNDVCLGYEEVNDVKAVLNYIKGQEKYKDVPIVLHGVSMGGAIAINSFGELKDIDGLIAMSAYSSFEDVVSDTMRRYHIPKFICNIEKSMVRTWLSVKFGDKVYSNKPMKQIQNIGERPALLIACTGDTEVQAVNMRRLLEKAPEQCESWTRESWEHFIIKDCDFANMEQDLEYCERILEFLNSKIVK